MCVLHEQEGKKRETATSSDEADIDTVYYEVLVSSRVKACSCFGGSYSRQT